MHDVHRLPAGAVAGAGIQPATPRAWARNAAISCGLRGTTRVLHVQTRPGGNCRGPVTVSGVQGRLNGCTDTCRTDTPGRDSLHGDGCVISEQSGRERHRRRHEEGVLLHRHWPSLWRQDSVTSPQGSLFTCSTDLRVSRFSNLNGLSVAAICSEDTRTAGLRRLLHAASSGDRGSTTRCLGLVRCATVPTAQPRSPAAPRLYRQCSRQQGQTWRAR